MGRLVTYLAITAIGLGMAFWIATTAATAISTSMNASAEMIARAGR